MPPTNQIACGDASDEMTFPSNVQEVLIDWRRVQTRLQELPVSSPELPALYAESDRLRREYQSLVAKCAADYRREYHANHAALKTG